MGGGLKWVGCDLIAFNIKLFDQSERRHCSETDRKHAAKRQVGESRREANAERRGDERRSGGDSDDVKVKLNTRMRRRRRPPLTIGEERRGGETGDGVERGDGALRGELRDAGLFGKHRNGENAAANAERAADKRGADAERKRTRTTHR